MIAMVAMGAIVAMGARVAPGVMVELLGSLADDDDLGG